MTLRVAIDIGNTSYHVAVRQEPDSRSGAETAQLGRKYPRGGEDFDGELSGEEQRRHFRSGDRDAAQSAAEFIFESLGSIDFKKSADVPVPAGDGTVEIRVASVSDVATERLRKQLRRLVRVEESEAAEAIPSKTLEADRPNVRWVVIDRHWVPLELRVDEPDRVGIDRVLAAAAARRRFGDNVIVIDCGSAVTIDLVRNGIFEGGVIQ